MLNASISDKDRRVRAITFDFYGGKVSTKNLKPGKNYRIKIFSTGTEVHLVVNEKTVAVKSAKLTANRADRLVLHVK